MHDARDAEDRRLLEERNHKQLLAGYYRPICERCFLRLRDEANRPLLASGATPLGDSIKSFRTWYAGCDQGSCPRNSGWRDVAMVRAQLDETAFAAAWAAGRALTLEQAVTLALGDA